MVQYEDENTVKKKRCFALLYLQLGLISIY